MEIHFQLTRVPIPLNFAPPTRSDVGAWVEFRGHVRGEEAGADIAALEYEAYAPMAEREATRILRTLASDHACVAARVIHRTGIVPVGEAAIYVGIAARHRAEAFALLSGFMDRLKQDVPIWKVRALSSAELQRGTSPSQTAENRIHSAREVIELLQIICHPSGEERVDLSRCPGRVLREDVRALEDQPAFDRSSVDGYAVRMDDPSPEFTVTGEIRAGEWQPMKIGRGETVRIATGGALPGEDLQVIMKEDVLIDGGRIRVTTRNGDRNIRLRGEDAKQGQVVVPSGTVLSHGAIGLLASVGCTAPLVGRLPFAVHLVSGNEIVPPHQRPAAGEIRDSNSALVRAFLGSWDIVPEQKHVPEDLESLRRAVEQACASGPELILISGGASVGKHDFTRAVLEGAGFTIHVSKTKARPGKPLIVAQRANTIAFGLPGNPLAHFVCLNLYVRAALHSWVGATQVSTFQQGFLSEPLNGGANSRQTFWPAACSIERGTTRVRPLRWSSSGDLTSLAFANALICVEANSDELREGAMVDFIQTQRTAA